MSLFERQKDLLYLYINTHNEYGGQHPLFVTYPKGFFNKLIGCIKHLLGFTFYYFKKKDLFETENTNLLYVISQNNINALKPILELNNAEMAKSSLKLSSDINIKLIKRSPLYFILAPYLYIRFLIWNPSFSINHFDLIFYSIGYYESFISFLKRKKVKSIIFSNDHNYDTRALLLASKTLNIPSIYLQHATVTSKFPPLKFDLSLLYGKESEEKYENHGSLVKLIGNPKFDQYFDNIKSLPESIKTIGIAYNTTDNLEIVTSLIKTIENLGDYKVILRAHPLEKRELPITPSTKISKNESSYDFILNCDAIISGNSSILLESSMMNVYSFYFDLNKIKEVYDYYGFVRNNLVPEIKSLNEIQNTLQQTLVEKNSPRNKTKYFNDTTNTPFDGKSTVLALQEINKFLSN